MDLFGDLPTAKNSSNNISQSKQSAPTSAVSDIRPSGTNDVKPKAPIPILAPITSLKKQLGKAGTTFAFVPAAIRHKNKSTTPKLNKISGNTPQKSSAEATSTNVSIVQTKYVSAQQAIKIPSTTVSSEEDKKYDQTDEDEEIRQLHLSVAESESSMSTAKQQEANIKFDYSRIDPKNMTPYNPIIPNDYLAYKDGQKKRRRRVELERSTLEALHQQEVMRERIDQERKKAQESGDINKIIESRQNSSFTPQAMGTLFRFTRGFLNKLSMLITFYFNLRSGQRSWKRIIQFTCVVSKKARRRESLD